MPDSLRQFKAEIFQALAHPTRIAILEQLRDGELTVSSFVERLGLEQANLSQHLSLLRARQIVVTRKVGNLVFYSVRDRVMIEPPRPHAPLLPPAGGRIHGAARGNGKSRPQFMSFSPNWPRAPFLRCATTLSEASATTSAPASQLSS